MQAHLVVKVENNTLRCVSESYIHFQNVTELIIVEKLSRPSDQGNNLIVSFLK